APSHSCPDRQIPRSGARRASTRPTTSAWSPFAVGETGTATRLVIYLARPAGVSQRMRPVIYRHAAGGPRARGRGRSERSLGRREASGLPLAAPVALAPGTYWLGLLTGDTSQATVHFLGTTPGKKVSGLRVRGSGNKRPFRESSPKGRYQTSLLPEVRRSANVADRALRYLRALIESAIFIFSGQKRIWGLYRCASSGSVMIDAASMPACS